MDVCVLGSIGARVEGDDVRIGSATQRLVLAALARDPGRVVPSERLQWVVWGDDPPATARASLQSHVSRLRGALDPGAIATHRAGYALAVGADRVDAHRFERGVRAATTVEDLDRTLALWRGAPFGEHGDHPFLADEKVRLTGLHDHARVRRAWLLLEGGRPDEAVAELEAVVARDPLREPAWVLLLRALHRAGRQAEAVGAAHRYRRRVAEEGLEPSPRFTAAEDEVFTSAPPRSSDPAAAASAAAETSGPTGLPWRLATFVGRADEVDEVVGRLLERPLVTLVGPPGVGKTSLAVEAARAAAPSFPDGAWVAPLADLDEPGSLVAAVARAVGAPMTEPLETSLHGYLRARRALLVLDNAEHVLDTAARTVQRLAGAAPDLCVLVTSRQPLGVAGEVVVTVDPLDADAALELFTDRVADAGAGIGAHQRALAAEVCARLDRLPLAIEMAAARVRSLGLEALADRLHQRMQLLQLRDARGDARIRTLREVVGWSHDLLDGDQQALLAQLSVFAGGFDLHAAEDVCDVDGPADAGVADLVDRSLVRVEPRPDGHRYHLLETVRQYAAEHRHRPSAPRGPEHRHAQRFAALAERIGVGLLGPDERTWAGRFDTEVANIEAAHRRTLTAGDADTPARISAALYPLVYHRLRADVGAWAEAALEAVTAAAHPLRTAVAAVAAVNHLHRGEPGEAEALLADLPDDPSSRRGHEVLGDLHTYRGDLDEALAHWQRAGTLADAAGDRFGALFAATSTAIVLGYAGEQEEATAIVDRTRAAAADVDSPLLRAWLDYAEGEVLADSQPRRAASLVGSAAIRAGEAGWSFLHGVASLTAGSITARSADAAEALPAFDRLIRHWRRSGDEAHQWTTLRNLVELLARVGADAEAARLLGAVEDAPIPSFGDEQQRLAETADRLRDTLGETRFAETVATGREVGRRGAATLALRTLREFRELRESDAGREQTIETNAVGSREGLEDGS